MIKAFLFEKFKSFDKAVLWVEQLTTLIGSNASGKSNVIEGIQILSELSTGRELNVVFDGTKNSESGIRGGASGCCRFGAGSFTLGCTFSYDAVNDILYRIRVGVNGRISVEEEAVYLVKKAQTDARNGSLIFKAIAKGTGSGDIDVEYRNGKVGPNPSIAVLRSMSVLSQMQSHLPKDFPEYEKDIEIIRKIKNDLSKVFVLEPVPSMMRAYSRVGDGELRRNCNNISSVLFELKENYPEKWEEFCRIVKQLPENEIKDIGFVKTVINDVILIQKEQNGNIDAVRLSDGTLRCMACLAAVLSEPEGSLIAIEEVDNGIHPGRVRMLVKELHDITAKRNIDLIITTHNATMLNGFDKKEVMGVSIAYRDSETQSSKIASFLDIKNEAAILASGGIGDALESEKILSFVKNNSDLINIEF